MDSRELFEILVRENCEMVRAYLLSSVRDLTTAEELLQEAFVVAWKKMETYDRSLPFGAWVRGIANKLVLNHRREYGRSKMYYCDEETLSEIDRGFDEFLSQKANSFDERLDALRDCMEKLPDEQRLTLRLHYENGLQCKEISARKGIGLETVKKHLQRGRAALELCIRSRTRAPQEEAV